MANDAKIELLRHALATLAYRGGKAVRECPAECAGFKAAATSRTPVEILAHIGDLMDWGLSIARGKQAWNTSTPLAWEREVERFFTSLKAFDEYLASGETVAVAPEKLFQGPVADALTHVGQIAMLRRMAGSAVKGENYFVADIASGRVGREQAQPKREF